MLLWTKAPGKGLNVNVISCGCTVDSPVELAGEEVSSLGLGVGLYGAAGSAVVQACGGRKRGLSAMAWYLIPHVSLRAY